MRCRPRCRPCPLSLPQPPLGTVPSATLQRMLAEERVRGTTWVDPSGVWTTGGSKDAADGEGESSKPVDFNSMLARRHTRARVHVCPSGVRTRSSHSRPSFACLWPQPSTE